MGYCKICGLAMRSHLIVIDAKTYTREEECLNPLCSATKLTIKADQLGDDFTWCIQQINELKKTIEAMK